MGDELRQDDYIQEIVGKVRAKLGCSEAEARKYLTDHLKEFSPEVRDKIVSAFLMEAVEETNAENRKKLEDMKRVRVELESEIAEVGERRASPEEPPTPEAPVLGAAAMGLLAKLMNDFGDDITGGMKFLKAHFSELEEPDRSALYKILCEREGEMPKEAQQQLAMLAFQCDAGREQLIEGLEKSARKLPPGQLRRNMIGE